jgi:DNA mismatch endonuclease (patch repair protein)
MADIKTPQERSYNMSRIRGVDTKPEMLVRKFLFAHGFRYRLHDKKLPGKPDLVLPKYKTVIFVNGCFWHGHDGCKYFVIPRTRREFWLSKINRTKEIDLQNYKLLSDMGYRVLTIWECELKTSELREQNLTKLVSVLSESSACN